MYDSEYRNLLLSISVAQVRQGDFDWTLLIEDVAIDLGWSNVWMSPSELRSQSSDGFHGLKLIGTDIASV